MTETDVNALAVAIKGPRGRVLLTFLHELAVEEALAATQTDQRDQAFAHSQRAAGLMSAHKQLEALAKDETSGA